MFFLKILDILFSRIFFYKFNILILKLVLRFIGYNHNENIKKSGEIYFLNKVCRERNSLCIDIGAHKGEYSKYILENSNHDVIAFEPMKSSFNKLKIFEKDYPKRFSVFNLALSNNVGKKKIYFDKKNLQWSTLDKKIDKIDYLKNLKNFETCKVTKLDFFLKRKKKISKNIKLIKIDTEGHEYEVLQGAKYIIKSLKPKYIQIEYNWHHLFKNINLYTISEFLKSYDVYKIFPYNGFLMKIDPKRPENNYFNYSNIVFKKK